MKNKILKRIVLLILIVLSVTLCVTACKKKQTTGDDTGMAEVTIQSIAVVPDSVPSEVEVGKIPDFTGIKVNVSYSDGTSKQVGYEDVTLSTLDVTTAGSKVVTVTYSGHKTTFTVNIIEKTAILESITIVPGTVATSVKRGDTYDVSALQVVGNYSDGTVRALAIEDVTVTTVDTSSAGDKTLTVTYGDKAATLAVKVIDITKLSVVTGTVADKIYVGQTLDVSKIQVVVAYADNETKTVEAHDLVVGTIDTTTIGDKDLSISYKGFESKFEVEVVGPVSLKVQNTEGFARSVKVLSSFSSAAAQAEITYSDGTKAVVGATALTIGTVDTSTAGVKKLTVTYTEGGISVSEEIDITVVGVKDMIVDDSVAKEILKGESFDISRIELTGKYTDDQPFTLTKADVVITGAIDGNTAGEQTLTITYLDKTITYTVKVCEVVRIEVTGVPLYVPSGELIDLSAMEVSVVYNTSDSKKIKVTTGYTTNVDELNANKDDATNDRILVVSYNGEYGSFNCSVTIDVEEPLLDEIVIESYTTSVRYKEAYTANLKVIAVYGNGRRDEITNYEITSAPINTAVVGKQTITVSYGGKTASVEVDVIGIKSIAVVGGTLPTMINKGDAFDYSRVSVIVTYDNDTTKTVTSGITVNVPTLVDGDNNITVSYEGVSITFVCHVKYISSIEIFAGLADVKREGYDTSVDNLQLKLNYSDGTEETVYARALTGVTYTGLEAGNLNFSVTYGGKTATKTFIAADISQVHALNGTIPGYILEGNKLSYSNFKLTVIYHYIYNGKEKEEVYLIGLDDPRLSVTPSEDEFKNEFIVKTDDPEFVDSGERIIQFTYAGYTASAKIIVKGVSSIEIVPGTVLTAVKVGQDVDLTKIQVRVNYTDGSYIYVGRSNLQSVTMPDKSSAGTKTLTVTYGGYKKDHTASIDITYINVSADASTGMIFAAILPDEIIVRETYKQNFTDGTNPYYVGDDNNFILYLNVAVLNSEGYLEEGIDGRGVRTSLKVYENDSELTGEALTSVVAHDPINNTLDFTEAAIGRTFTLKICPADSTRYLDPTAVTKTHTVTVVDGYNVYHAYELNLVTNVVEGDWVFDGDGMTDDLVFSQGTVVTEFLTQKGIAQYRNGLNGIVLHGNINITKNDLPSKYIVNYTKDGQTYEALVDQMGIFNHISSVGSTFSIYGNYYSIFSYDIPAVAHKGFGNNQDNYSSSTLFELQANNNEFDYYYQTNLPTENIVYNIKDLALRDNDPHSNDQSASERHMRGLSAFQVGESTVNITNVNIDAYMMSLSTEEDQLYLNIDKSKFYNAWQGHLFLYSNNHLQQWHNEEGNPAPWSGVFGQKVNITNSLLGKCGGPVILAQNANRDKSYNYGLSIDVVVDQYTDKHLYSYVTGEEAWFVAVNQVPLAKKIILSNQLFLGVAPQLKMNASFTSTDKIAGVETVNMKMVVMGGGDLTGGSIAEHRGSYTVGETTVMNMKVNSDSENKALKDMLVSHSNKNIFQSSSGGIAYYNEAANVYGGENPFVSLYTTPEEIGYNLMQLFSGGYVNIYTSGIGILLEYYH